MLLDLDAVEEINNQEDQDVEQEEIADIEHPDWGHHRGGTGSHKNSDENGSHGADHNPRHHSKENVVGGPGRKRHGW